ncbi:unnamed protein product [Somion occarium]|uniref:Major facilitator superfamily (MFS) profile domain-containing protein n=1 Tax=Somion occarium TaxID=3059160 RepID=A0ABP1DLL2_9APHY
MTETEKLPNVSTQTLEVELGQRGEDRSVTVQPAALTFDSGAKAWCNLIGGWCALFATFGYTNAFGVYQDFYTRSDTASASAISWIGSTQVFLLTSLGLISGKLLDHGYFRHTIFAGSVLYVFSLFMLSIADTSVYYQLFLAQGVGMGLGGGLIYIPCVAIQSHHWRARRAMAIGIVFTGSSLGGIVFPIMLNQLLSEGTSFGWSVRATAFVVLGLLALVNILMSPRAEMLVRSEAHLADLKAVITDVPYMLTIFGAFCGMLGIFYPYFYTQLFAITHGVDSNVAFYTIAMLNAGSIPGRVLPGILAHRLGTFNFLIFSTAAMAVVIFALFGISSVGGIVVFAILAGLFSGAYFSLLAAAMASFARTPGEAGLRMGLSFALAALGLLTGTPIIGALLGSNLVWSKTIIFSGVTVVAGLIVFVLSRQIVAHRKASQIV